MKEIIEGIAKFQREVYPQQINLFKKLAVAQITFALLITCSDSRVVPELLTQSDPGALFVIRTRGTSFLLTVRSRAEFQLLWNTRCPCSVFGT